MNQTDLKLLSTILNRIPGLKWPYDYNQSCEHNQSIFLNRIPCLKWTWFSSSDTLGHRADLALKFWLVGNDLVYLSEVRGFGSHQRL